LSPDDHSKRFSTGRLQRHFRDRIDDPRERVYPPVGSLALGLLYDALDAAATSFRQLDGGLSPAPGRKRIPTTDRTAIAGPAAA
jgi:hypothetical protein